MSKKYFFFYGGERDEMPEIEPIPINREIIEQEGTVRERLMRQIGGFYDYAIQMAFVPDGIQHNLRFESLARDREGIRVREEGQGAGRRITFKRYSNYAFIPQASREQRFDDLRAKGKKLGEINAILEAEGYSEVFGEGVMPCPTKSHEIVRENKGAKKMIGELS